MDTAWIEPELDVDAIQKAANARGWNMSMLAAQAGVSHSTLSLMMQGKRPNTSAVMLARIALALGCSVDHLLGMSAGRTPEYGYEVWALLRRLPRSARRAWVDWGRDLAAALQEAERDALSTIVEAQASDEGLEVLVEARRIAATGDEEGAIGLIEEFLARGETTRYLSGTA